MDNQLAAIEAQLKSVWEMLKRIDKTLHGNGHPGIVRQVDRNTERIESRRWLDRLIISSLVVALVGVIVTASLSGVFTPDKHPATKRGG